MGHGDAGDHVFADPRFELEGAARVENRNQVSVDDSAYLCVTRMNLEHRRSFPPVELRLIGEAAADEMMGRGAQQLERISGIMSLGRRRDVR